MIKTEICNPKINILEEKNNIVETVLISIRNGKLIINKSFQPTCGVQLWLLVSFSCKIV